MQLTRFFRPIPLILCLAIAALFAAAPPAGAVPNPTIPAKSVAPVAANSSSAATKSATPAANAAPDAMVQLVDEVAGEVEALRGWKFKEPVKKALCTSEEARAIFTKMLEKQLAPEKVAITETFLQMVGLVPPKCDLKKAYLDVLEEQAAGFYDTETKTLYLVKRAGPPSPMIDRIMIAHELTHALDDQRFDLAKFIKGFSGRSEDAELVGMSIMEGSATALMTQYMTRALISGKFNVAELQKYADEESKRSKIFTESPRYFTSMIGAYICGMNFLAKGHMMAMLMQPNDRAVGENLEDAVKTPPTSMKQILHPEKYWNPDTRDEPVVPDDAAVEKLLAGTLTGKWSAVHKDTLGELLVAILTRPKDAPFNPTENPTADAWTTPAASGWVGDRFYLMAQADAKDKAKNLDKAKGLWLTFWDAEASRDAFLKAYTPNAPAGHAVMKFGNLGAVFFFGFDEAERKAIEKKLESAPPAMLRGGKPWTPWAI